MQNYDYLVNINLLFLNLMTLGPRQRGTFRGLSTAGGR